MLITIINKNSLNMKIDNNNFITRGITKERKFVYGYYLKNNLDHYIVTDKSNFSKDLVSNFCVDCTEIIQKPDRFLGITDDRKKEVFENDIVEFYTPSCYIEEDSVCIGYHEGTPMNQSFEISREPYIKTQTMTLIYNPELIVKERFDDDGLEPYLVSYSFVNFPEGASKYNLWESFGCEEKDWNINNEESWLNYLLKKYSLANEEELIKKLNSIKVIGNSHNIKNND